MLDEAVSLREELRRENADMIHPRILLVAVYADRREGWERALREAGMPWASAAGERRRAPARIEFPT